MSEPKPELGVSSEKAEGGTEEQEAELFGERLDAATERIAGKMELKHVTLEEIDDLIDLQAARQEASDTYRYAANRAWNSLDEQSIARLDRLVKSLGGNEGVRDLEQKFNREVHDLLPEVCMQSWGFGWSTTDKVYRREDGKNVNIDRELAEQGIKTDSQVREWVATQQQGFLEGFKALSPDEQWKKVSKMTFLHSPRTFARLWGEGDGSRYPRQVQERVKEILTKEFLEGASYSGYGASRGGDRVVDGRDLEDALRRAKDEFERKKAA